MPAFIDLTGQNFGKLKVTGLAPKQGRRTVWRVQCECGTTAAVLSESLRSGSTRSCGCLQKEVCSARLLKHGHSRDGSRAYRIWLGMVSRCTNPKNKAWPRYGGRGIAVSQRWRKFENFLADMGAPPAGLQLDRIDNSRGYSSDNCRWATRSQNMRNTSNNQMTMYRGQRMLLAVAAEIAGINYRTLRSRQIANGETGDRLFRPVRAKKEDYANN